MRLVSALMLSWFRLGDCRLGQGYFRLKPGTSQTVSELWQTSVNSTCVCRQNANKINKHINKPLLLFLSICLFCMSVIVAYLCIYLHK